MGTFQGRETYLKDKLSLGNASADCTVTAEAMCMPKEHSTIATHEDQDAAIVSASKIPTTTESVNQDLLRSGRQVKVSCSFHVSIFTTYNFGIHIDRCFCVSVSEWFETKMFDNHLCSIYWRRSRSNEALDSRENQRRRSTINQLGCSSLIWSNVSNIRDTLCILECPVPKPCKAAMAFVKHLLNEDMTRMEDVQRALPQRALRTRRNQQETRKNREGLEKDNHWQQ